MKRTTTWMRRRREMVILSIASIKLWQWHICQLASMTFLKQLQGLKLMRTAEAVHLLPVLPIFFTKWMYLFMVNIKFWFYLHIYETQCIAAPARQYLAEQMAKKTFLIVMSLWVPSYLYIISNSLCTILATVSSTYQMALKCWDYITEEEENTLTLSRETTSWWFSSLQGISLTMYPKGLSLYFILPAFHLAYWQLTSSTMEKLSARNIRVRSTTLKNFPPTLHQAGAHPPFQQHFVSPPSQMRSSLFPKSWGHVLQALLDCTPIVIPFLHVQASMVECISFDDH